MGQKILIVDDDEIAGSLSRDILQDAGYEADLLTDSMAAMDKIRAERPDMVILDILMPGIDGLTLCHKIKSDPQLKSTKVVMVSGKSFAAERQRARQYGADLFIEKPYHVDTFAQQIAEVAARPTGPQPKPSGILPQLTSAPDAVMQVSVWGCRSLAGLKAGGASAYGRRTSCVSVEAGEHLLIFDSGTGISALGSELVKNGKHKEVWLFLSHFHRDHVEGLGSFPCVSAPGYTIRISGAKEPDKTLEELVRQAFESSLQTQVTVQADIELYEILEESYEIIPGFQLSSFYANHPGTTLGFVLESQGRKLVYCPDSEIYGESVTALQDYDEKLGRLCAGADLLIHDGRYTVEDYHKLKNTGHSNFATVVDLAGNNNVKRLMLFHHDNEYSDQVLDKIGADAAEIVSEKGYGLEVVLAKEGLKLGI